MLIYLPVWPGLLLFLLFVYFLTVSIPNFHSSYRRSITDWKIATPTDTKTLPMTPLQGGAESIQLQIFWRFLSNGLAFHYEILQI